MIYGTLTSATRIEMATDTPAKDKQASHWGDELERAKKRYRTFWENGDATVDAYRLQKPDGNDVNSKDKYNILYSSTETIRPNLYATTPRPVVSLRSKDTASEATRAAALLLEGCITYLEGEEDFDELMRAAVEDYLLPGLGTAWVRYDATFEKQNVKKGDTPPPPVLLDEMVKIEYVYWQDFLTGIGRTWKETPWVAKRLWLTKAQATERFGAVKAGYLKYAMRESTGREQDNPSETAEAWEIWNKADKTVYWFGEGCPELLGSQKDPLKLKKFFPCPRPMRAISNTRTFVPRAFYSQYKSQAETLNVLTKRIRLLSEALRVVGFYDGSVPRLADALNPAAGNRMIAVDNWAAFAEKGGIIGGVAWLPIDAVVKTLTEVLKAREVCKAEIYEITGFSDVIRGVSKASETLGAQNLKANWAGARVREMQSEVQRFARDLLALSGELVAEHCAPETIAIFSGIQIPSADAIKANPALQNKLQLFKDACDILRDELRRVSVIEIETDSTLLADTEAERADRTQFLSAAGAFLQQAVPAMEASPELAGVLGAMLMFTVRSFPSARIIEEEFEQLTQAMAKKQPQPDKNGVQAKNALDQQKLQQDGQIKQAELQQKAQSDEMDRQLEMQKEQNRHGEAMAKLAIEQERLAIERQKLTLERFKAYHEAGMREEEHASARTDKVVEREDERTDKMNERIDAADAADRADDNASQDREQRYDQMDREAQERAQEAQEAQERASEGEGGE